jgi:hypothetical protein
MLVESPPRAAHAQAAVGGEYQAAARRQKQQLPAGPMQEQKLPAGPSKVLVNTGGQQAPAEGSVGFHPANGNALVSSCTNPVAYKAGAKEDVVGVLVDTGAVLIGGLVFGLLIWLIMRRIAQQRAQGDSPPSKADYLPLDGHLTKSGDAQEPARAEEQVAGGVGAKEVEDLKVRAQHG